MIAPLMVSVLRREHGAVLPLFGFIMVVLAGFAALAIDVGHLYTSRARLQAAADAAALAAALDLPNQQTARDTVISYVTKNLNGEIHPAQLEGDEVQFGKWDVDAGIFSADASPANAVRVRLALTAEGGNAVPTFFARVLGIDSTDVVVSAVARASAPPICVLALDTSGRGIDMSNGTIAADGCVIHANSSASDAIAGQANAEMSAAQICVVGNYQTGPTYSPTPETDCPNIADPLADLQPPSFTGTKCDYSKVKVGTGDATLDPGIYCGGLDLTTNGTVTLNPGQYIIKDAPLSVGGNTKVNGTGVSFYLTAKSNVKIAGGATLNLSAPIEGPMAGVLFFGDRALDPSKMIHDFVGGASVRYEGTIYFPTTPVRFVGNASAATSSPFTMFIAKNFQFAGIAEIHLAVDSNYYASEVPLPGGLKATSTRLVQ